MKNLCYFVILAIGFSVGGCKCNSEPENSYIIIKFDDDISIPQRIISADSAAYQQYLNLQNAYKNLHNFNDLAFQFQNVESAAYTQKFTTGFAAILSKKFKIFPLFNTALIKQYYNKFSPINLDTANVVNGNCAKPASKSLPPNLQNYFVITTCLLQSDAELFVKKLNLLNLKFSASFETIPSIDDRAIQEKKKPLLTAKDKFFDFRKAMNIDALNFRESINGKNANIVIIENAKEIDFSHFKFSKIQQNFAQRKDNLGFGANPTHATNTFGLIFADTDFPNINTPNIKLATACKGIADKTNLLKMIYYSDYVCDKTPDIYNALLKAIVEATQGDIILFELGSGDFPIEFNPLCHELVLSASNNFGIIVIEPIGNNGKDLDNPKLKILGGAKKPIDFAGILVGATDTTRVQTNNYSATHLTCFAYGDKLLTTHNAPANSYTLFGSTSGASAIIAGLACDMQGYYNQRTGCYLSPQDMKNLFRNTRRTNSNTVTNSKTGKVFQQVIPDALQLKSEVDRIIDRVRP
jgi:hypothetical protein